MTTDNRTNERRTPEAVVAEALAAADEYTLVEDAVCAALHAHGLLMQEPDAVEGNAKLLKNSGPSEAQVEAAAKALRADEGFMEEVHSALEVSWSEYIARLVLVAAQGAAPQAESSPTSSYISPSLPGMIRNLWKSDPSENSVRTALKLAGDLIQELIDLRAAPVLPSSGVDEAALAEVVDNAEEAWEHLRDMGRRPGSRAEYIARAVAAWLKDGAR